MQINGQTLPVIDVDTHVVEPVDLWTSRMPERFSDFAPHVAFHNQSGRRMWCIGDDAIFPAFGAAHARWKEFPPSSPEVIEDVAVEAHDLDQRLAMMDATGIDVQILYPNIAMFNSDRLQAVGSREAQNRIISVYNDWQLEWTAPAGGRLWPMGYLPFWDLEACVAEAERMRGHGVRGVIMSQNPAGFGLPKLSDRHWDPLWHTLQEMQMPVNFHIGSGGNDGGLFTEQDDHIGTHSLYAMKSCSLFMANASTMIELILGGVCHRYPDLKFVSVESGVGYIPFLLELMDWQFLNSGAKAEHPEYSLLPSEYWKRQVYACFWFERGSLRQAVHLLGSENFLFESDFPHPTSQTRGPATYAVGPDEYAASALAEFSAAEVRNLVHDNAVRVYGDVATGAETVGTAS